MRRGCGGGAVEFRRTRDGVVELTTSNTVFIAHLECDGVKNVVICAFSRFPLRMLSSCEKQGTATAVERRRGGKGQWFSNVEIRVKHDLPEVQ